MARVTVEDCLENVDNRFELVLVASKRARQITRGKGPRVDWENDKPTVVALREIAEGLVSRESMEREEAMEKARATEEAAAAAVAAASAEIGDNTPDTLV